MRHMFNLPLCRVPPRVAKVIRLKVLHSLGRRVGIVSSGLVDSSLFADAGVLQKSVATASDGFPVRLSTWVGMCKAGLAQDLIGLLKHIRCSDVDMSLTPVIP